MRIAGGAIAALLIALAAMLAPPAAAQPLEIPSLPDCPDSGGNHLNWTKSTITPGCGTSVPAGVELTAHKNAASGYAPLDANSLVPFANLPASLPWVGIPLGAVGVPGNSQIDAKLIPFACAIPANLSSLTAPPVVAAGWAFVTSTGTATLALSYLHSGSHAIGNVVFTAATSAPAMPSANSAASLAAGDLVVLTFPATADATLADVHVTIPCKKTTP